MTAWGKTFPDNAAPVDEALSMTAQAPDQITYKSREYPLLGNPLEAYFSAENPRPAFPVWSTTSWRGYVAHWTVTGDRLHLVGLDLDTPFDLHPVSSETGGRPDADQPCGGEGNGCPRSRAALTDIFPQGAPVQASWYTGRLRLAVGRMTEYVHSGYASYYEAYIILTVENGRVVEVQHEDGETHRREQEARANRWWENFVKGLQERD